MGEHRRAAPAPRRSDPEPRRGGSRIRGARARRLRGGDAGTGRRSNGAQTPGAAADANEGLTGALGRLFAVAEAYPELRASENFLELQEDLTDTEDKISAARRYYNATVNRFNTGVQSIPWVLVARPLGFHAREFFSAQGDTAPPQVSFEPAP